MKTVNPFDVESNVFVSGDSCDVTSTTATTTPTNMADIGQDECIGKDVPAEEEYNGFYRVRPMSFHDSPDSLRGVLEDALHTLSLMFREYPTLPASPADTTQHLFEARENHCALLLPRKHCAFRGCGWCGPDALSLAKHIDDDHRRVLDGAMKAYKDFRTVRCQDECILALSVYNEGIATAIRRGAPLASYSIDRKCIMEYNKHLTHEGTGTSVCFACARRFPRVHGTKNNPIRFYRLLTNTSVLNVPTKATRSQDDIDSTVSFLGCVPAKETEKMFGLNTDCETYGKINEDVTLPATHEEFDDWHICVPFGSHSVKVLLS